MKVPILLLAAAVLGMLSGMMSLKANPVQNPAGTYAISCAGGAGYGVYCSVLDTRTGSIVRSGRQ